MIEFNLEDFKNGYRGNHHNIEWSIQNYMNAGINTYEKSKKQFIQNIDWQINYLKKQKEMLENE